MDLFQHRYYRLNKTLMKLVGQWPYQYSRSKSCFRAVIIYINASEMLFRILDIVKHRNDIDVLFDCAIPLFCDLLCVTSFIVLMSNSSMTLQLLNRIRKDWQVWAQHPEVTILHEYADQGQRMNIVLTATGYFAWFGNVTSLFVLKIIDALLMNDTEPGTFPTRVYYYRIDTEKYYFYVMIYYSIMVAAILMAGVANIVMFITYVQHACGIFAALGRKLERIGYNDTAIETREIAYAVGKRATVHLAWCIDRHNDAIEYSNLIEGMYTWLIGPTIFFTVVLMNVLGLQILTSTGGVQATSITIIVGTIFLLIVGFYNAQKLIDHSVNISFYIYNDQWYRLSVEAQKFIQLMTMRCIVPCQLTAGKILIMSVSNCGMLLRATASYFAILRSTRGL